jgi:hypothetical protein
MSWPTFCAPGAESAGSTLITGSRRVRILGSGTVAGMPAVSTLDDLRDAVADFAVTRLDLPFEPDAWAAARRSLDGAGFLLLGEVHGVAENPLIVREVMRALGLTSLALEWPTGLAGTVDGFLRDGTLADDGLLWSGDGRITAGHLATLRDLWAAGGLRLTLFDRPWEVNGTWSQRDAAMAAELLGSGAARVPTLVVAGSLHTQTAVTAHGVSLGAHLAARRPAVRGIDIRYHGGRFYNLASRRFPYRSGPGSRAGVVVAGDRLVADLPTAHEAVVPHRPAT